MHEPVNPGRLGRVMLLALREGVRRRTEKSSRAGAPPRDAGVALFRCAAAIDALYEPV